MHWCLLIALPNPQFDCYRLILVLPATRSVLAEQSRHLWRLPRISIPRWSRAAAEIQAVLREQWRLKTVVVDLLEERLPHEPIAIAELRGVRGFRRMPRAYQWVSLRDVCEDEIGAEDRPIVERLLNDGSTGRGAFSRFGWIEEALDWVGAKAGMDRAQFMDDVKQFNAAHDSALVRFGRRDAPPIWFKAAGGPSTSEYGMTTLLSQLLPGYLPAVVATREDWSAWWMEDAGAPLSSVPSPGLFGKAVSRLADLQKASMDSIPHLLARGCSDQRLSILRADISPMMDLIGEAMARQGNGFAPRLTSARIRELEAILTGACLSIENLGIPDTLLHGDVSFENILIGPRGCVFTDWANTAVGNPLVTFEQLRAQIEQENGACVWLPMLTEIYIGSWLEVLSRSQIECGLALVPPIAAMTYLFDQWKRLGSEHRSEPKFQSYVRGLAREMVRAAHDIELRWSRCA